MVGGDGKVKTEAGEDNRLILLGRGGEETEVEG